MTKRGNESRNESGNDNRQPRRPKRTPNKEGQRTTGDRERNNGAQADRSALRYRSRGTCPALDRCNRSACQCKEAIRSARSVDRPCWPPPEYRERITDRRVAWLQSLVW
ncbi:MAG: hypothetical protein HQK96_09920 [Nitrospirae bacterium]|nr:hypothetical protein [Nitrospirota bacterium]